MTPTLTPLKSRLAASVLWALPATILCEYLARWIEKPPIVRIAFFGLFLCAYWIAELPSSSTTQASSTQDATKHNGSRGKRVLGVACVVLGALGLGITIWKIWGTALGLPPLALPHWLGRDGARLSLPILCAWPLALGAAWARGRAVTARSYEQLGLWIAFAMLVQLASGERVQNLQLLPNATATLGVLLLSLSVLIALLSSARGPFNVRLGILVFAGACLQLVSLGAWDIEPTTRDMLPLVEAAQARFFALGEHPYAAYAMQRGSEVPLTYMPGLWLGYAIPRALDLDIRVISVVSQVGFAAALAIATRKIEPQRQPFAQALVFVFCACWFFSPSVLWNVIYAEPPLWWGVLGMLACAWLMQSYLWTALLLGVALSMRHFAVVLLPFALLFFVRALGVRRALPYLAITGCVTALLIAPFALSNPELFWFGTFRWLREYGPAHITWFYGRFSFMDWFRHTGTLKLMPTVQVGQAIVLLGLAVWALRARERRLQSIAFASTAYALGMLLNILFWDSFVLDAAVLAVCGVLARHVPLVTAERPEPRRAVLVLSGLGFAASAVIALLLVRSLVHAELKRAPGALTSLLTTSLGPRDALIDRSDRRMAFVDGTWLMQHSETPAAIGDELYSRRWLGRPAFETRDALWLVTDVDRDPRMREMFPRLGRPTSHKDQSFGHLRVQSVDAHAARSITEDDGVVYAVRGKRTEKGLRSKHCTVGAARARMLSFPMPGAPDWSASLRWPSVTLGQTLVIAGGSPDPQILWPKPDTQVELTVRKHADASPQVAPFERAEIRNLRGMHWHAWDTSALAGRDTSVQLTFRSVAGPRATERLSRARELCLELFVLE